MGIFSLFGKKKAQKTSAGEGAGTRRASAGPRSERRSATRRDTEAAQATVLKIDAIESEMSSEFIKVKGEAVRKSARNASAVGKSTASASNRSTEAKTAAKRAAPAPLHASAEGPSSLSRDPGNSTAFLLEGTSTLGHIATPAANAAALIEGCAILFANGQSDLVEQMLCEAIAEDELGEASGKAWWMLFDLYQLTGRREQFEQLAIDYANKFEASPPAWVESVPVEAAALPTASAPLVAFSGRLDAKSARIVERAKTLAQTHPALRLEFLRVTEVDRDGCVLLLALLLQLQKSNHELILIGARELTEKIRAIIEVGRRSDGEACWLLLLEILRLLDYEKEFEEASIDYCVTFEVSPPAFVTRQSTVSTAEPEQIAAPETEAFPMPRLVEGRIDDLIVAIAAWSDEHDPAIIDCSQLERIDFNAAGRLLTGLAPFCGNGKQIAFRQVNHLVSELFHVIGLDDIVRIVPRKS